MLHAAACKSQEAHFDSEQAEGRQVSVLVAYQKQYQVLSSTLSLETVSGESHAVEMRQRVA